MNFPLKTYKFSIFALLRSLFSFLFWGFIFSMLIENSFGIIFSVCFFVIIHAFTMVIKLELSGVQIKIKKPSIEKIIYITDITKVKIQESRGGRGFYSLFCQIQYTTNKVEQKINIDLNMLSDSDSFIKYLVAICLQNKISIENNYKSHRTSVIWERKKKKKKKKKR